MVVFGRPKGDRGSYKQWEEGNIAPQVVFEILSPGNTPKEMAHKLKFYQAHGVEEYYLYDPAKNVLQGWVKRDEPQRLIGDPQLMPVDRMEGWISPRLGSRFDTTSGMLELYGPDGQRFETFVEIKQRANHAVQKAEQESRRAEQKSHLRRNAIPSIARVGFECGTGNNLID
jgi:hypothetical protein